MWTIHSFIHIQIPFGISLKWINTLQKTNYKEGNLKEDELMERIPNQADNLIARQLCRKTPYQEYNIK